MISTQVREVVRIPDNNANEPVWEYVTRGKLLQRLLQLVGALLVQTESSKSVLDDRHAWSFGARLVGRVAGVQFGWLCFVCLLTWWLGYW